MKSPACINQIKECLHATRRALARLSNGAILFISSAKLPKRIVLGVLRRI